MFAYTNILKCTSDTYYVLIIVLVFAPIFYNVCISFSILFVNDVIDSFKNVCIKKSKFFNFTLNTFILNFKYTPYDELSKFIYKYYKHYYSINPYIYIFRDFYYKQTYKHYLY